MYPDKNPEVIKRRCEILESLGFEILHEDSSVRMNSLVFDFSAIDETKFVEYALNHATAVGVERGKEIIQEGLKDLLGVL